VRILVALVAVVILAVLVASATLAIAGSDDSGSADQARRGKLAHVSLQPLTLKGNGFVPGERVQVSASTSGAKETRTAKANGSGSFTLSFSGKLDTCNGLTVTAVGNRGTRTSFQLSQLLCLDE
jgi:hypothetical protein